MAEFAANSGRRDLERADNPLIGQRFAGHSVLCSSRYK